MFILNAHICIHRVNMYIILIINNAMHVILLRFKAHIYVCVLMYVHVLYMYIYISLSLSILEKKENDLKSYCKHSNLIWPHHI